MPLLPWTTHLSQGTYPEFVPWPIGKDKETKGIGDSMDHKDEWPKEPGTWTMHVLIVDKLDIMPGTVHKNEDIIPNPTSSTLTMRNQRKLPKIR